jgi:translation initiation factor 1
MSIQNFKAFGPFYEADEIGAPKDYLHIQIRKIGEGRKVTNIQGLPKKFEAKKLLKTTKKKCACYGNIIADAEMGELIQLQGDQRHGVQKFLMDEEGLDSESVRVHRF